MAKIEAIMINKGDEITCTETLKVNGKKYFTEGNIYKSPETNCLVDDNNEEVFVSQQYLKHFVFKL